MRRVRIHAPRRGAVAWVERNRWVRLSRWSSLPTCYFHSALRAEEANIGGAPLHVKSWRNTRRSEPREAVLDGASALAFL